MKIEMINDNQIKCTLTRSDLASRQLRLSEIAYGTEKANGLFRDMMDQANLEFGFDTSDFPVMVEAIPVSMDCIILMITKVEDPEEVDTRFPGLSVLKDLIGREFSEDPSSAEALAGDFSDDFLLNLESFVKEPQAAVTMHPQHYPKRGAGTDCLLSFDSLESVISYARQIADCQLTESSLYKSAADAAGSEPLFYLTLCFPSSGTGDYAYASTLALEFGRSETCSPSRLAHIREHMEPIILRDAIAQLSSL